MLFVVMTVANIVHGSWGPLPYDRERCVAHAAGIQQEFREKLKHHPSAIHRRFFAKTAFSCHSLKNEPVLGKRIVP